MLSNLNQIFNSLTEWQFAFLPWVTLHVSCGRILPLPLSNVRSDEIEAKMISACWKLVLVSICLSSAFFCHTPVLIPFSCSLITTVLCIIIKTSYLSTTTTIIIIPKNLTRCRKKGDPSNVELPTLDALPTSLYQPIKLCNFATHQTLKLSPGYSVDIQGGPFNCPWYQPRMRRLIISD